MSVSLVADRKESPWWFPLRFLFYCGVVYSLLNWAPESAFTFINRFTAASTAFLLQLLGAEPVLKDVLVSLGGFHARIIGECSAVFTIALFFAFVLAYPSSPKAKTIGLLLGVPAIHLANVLRLAAVIGVGAWERDWFPYAHVYMGQLAMMAVVFAACITWLNLCVNQKRRDTPLAFLARFIAFSSLPFLLWIVIHKGFVSLSDTVLAHLFSLFGQTITTSSRQRILYDETFNLIAFFGLITASRSIDSYKKFTALATGLPFLMLTNVMLAGCAVLAIHLHWKQALPIGNGLIILNQYCLPFLLWYLFTQKIRARSTI